MMALMVGRLFFLQVIQHDFWVAKAEKQQVMKKVVPARRGEIYMMDGLEPKLVVSNRSVWSVVVDPKRTYEKREKVRQVLEREAKDYLVGDLDKILSDNTKQYYVVAKGVERERAEKIRAEKLKGVWFVKGVERFYPEGNLGGSILGFVNAEEKGQYGVEGAMHYELKGKDGLLKTVKDIYDVPLTVGSDNIRVAPIDGKNVVLSVDINVQYKVERIIEEVAKKKKAEFVNAVVLNPQNGQVMAMGNWPFYNPAGYAKVRDVKVFNNQVIDEPYEPASVCKTFVYAAAFDKGLADIDTTFYNKDFVEVDGLVIKNAHLGYLGNVDMQKAFIYSLNTGSIDLLARLGGGELNERGRKILYEYYFDRFGLGKKSGIELFEVPGLIVKPDQGMARNHRYANMTFGQGMNTTMLSVAAAFSAVVNGGQYYRPSVVAGEMLNGSFVAKEKSRPERRVISEEASGKMRKLLAATRNYERNMGIDLPGYQVGGKTGTAEVSREGRYAKREYIASYVGFGGAKKPEFVIMVRIGGKGQAFDGWEDARPIFNEISMFMIDYLKIKPKEKK